MKTLLEGRTAFVTGAGQGNGEAIAKGLAQHGARVVATDINPESAARTAAQIVAAGGSARSSALDVTNREEATHLANILADEGWTVDLLVNNAGICPRAPVDSPDFEKAWDATIEINLHGMMRVTYAFLPHLRRSRGVVINIASIAAFVAVRSILAYSASKAGVRGLTQAMAEELADDGIRVNAIAPGQIATPMLAPSLANPERKRQIEARILLGRVAQPEELVGPIAFLASDMSSFVTGVTLPVDGGYLTS